MLSVVLLWMLAADGPRFQVETITIEGTRYTGRNIILSQARLVEGKPYTEEELRLAIVRIRQLTFIRDAAFFLRKGSRRGLYRLVIRIDENSLFFFEGSFNWSARPPDDEITYGDAYSGGLRAFLGKGALIYGYAVPKEETTNYHAGISHYNLFGQGIYFNIETVFFEPLVAREPGRELRNETTIYLDGTIRFPLRRAQWLALEHNYNEDSAVIRLEPIPGLRFDVDQARRSRFTSLSWETNTTDDPVFPETGALFRRSLSYSNRDTVEVRGTPAGEETRIESSDGLALDLEYARWHTPAWRHVVGLMAGGGVTNRQAEQHDGSLNSQLYYWQIGLGYRYQAYGHADRGDLFAGFDARLSTTYARYQEEGRADLDFGGDNFKLEPYLAWRSRWGLVKASLEIDWTDGFTRMGVEP